MNYTCKQLTSHDVADIKALLKVFGTAFEDVPTYQNAVPTDLYLKSLLEKPTNIVLVAQAESEVVGGLIAYVLEKFEQDRREIYIYDLAVAEAHRRQGIARSLIKKLQQIAQEKDAYIIFVQADRADTPAIGLYESFGSKEEVFSFDIPVDK